MSTTQQPEALRLADALERPGYGWHSTPEQCAAELRRLHAECEALRTGYAAARLEIESLRTRCVEPVGERTPKDYAIEHAEYMAQDAERLLEAINHLNAQRDEDGEAFDSDALAHAEEAATEAFGAVRNGIYEFRKRRDRAAAQPAGAQAAPELTETAVTAKNPAAPVSSFEDSRTQAVYEVLVKDNYPPAGSNEHWEGWKARLIVDALFPIEAPAAVAGPSEPKCSACGARLQEVTQGPNSYLSADQFDADKLGDWFCECCPEGPNKGSRKHRYFDNYELAAAPTTQPAPRLPERDASIPAEQQGMFRKFDVRRVDGSDQPGGKHHGCTYFVLDVDHDPCARPALAAYAAACEATHPALAADLRTKWGAVPAAQPAPGDALDEAMRERDEAEDFIDAMLDEVLGHERPEWSNSYGRADALNDVQERMTALHKPASDKAWGRFESAMAEPQQEAQEPCPTCTALARTVMLDQVSFDRKPDCYGIRQITDDEGVEEWEDIRTSPDVAREEANDMMATGRGEIYEVVPLWTTPQPSPAAQGDAKERDAAFEAVRQKLCNLPRYSFHSDGYGAVRRVSDKSGSWIGFDAAHALFDPVAGDAAIDAARAAQEGK